MTRSRRAALSALVALAATTAAGADADTTVGRVALDQFKKDLDQGKVVVIDVRSPENYQAGHIPGSLNVPLGNLSDHLERLKAVKKPIVAYCA